MRNEREEENESTFEYNAKDRSTNGFETRKYGNLTLEATVLATTHLNVDVMAFLPLRGELRFRGVLIPVLIIVVDHRH